MANPTPTTNALSKPVEPIFRCMAAKVFDESYAYGLGKYPMELHTFNGRTGDWAEEWVSMGRYVTQLEMEFQVVKNLLEKYFHAHNHDDANCPCVICQHAGLILRGQTR